MTGQAEEGAKRIGLPLFTIGHSNHSISDFVTLLRRHGVAMVADVRSRPYSRFVPHFGKERLGCLLEAQSLGYLYLGQELGGKPKSAPHPSPITFQTRTAQPEFRHGVDRLLEAARANRVALMCRERDPLDCHRFHLVCRHLWPLELDIRHILPGGEVEVQQSTERRLLERAGTPGLPLFRERAESASEQALSRAYDSWWCSSGG